MRALQYGTRPSINNTLKVCVPDPFVQMSKASVPENGVSVSRTKEAHGIISLQHQSASQFHLVSKVQFVTCTPMYKLF